MDNSFVISLDITVMVINVLLEKMLEAINWLHSDALEKKFTEWSFQRISNKWKVRDTSFQANSPWAYILPNCDGVVLEIYLDDYRRVWNANLLHTK